MSMVFNLSRIAGPLRKLSEPPSLGRRTGVPPVSAVVGRPLRARRSVVAWLATTLTLFTLACSTTVPRVLEVTSRTRLHDVDLADENLFIYDRASRIQYEPQDLSFDAQREEFYVHWTPASVGLVKFEYRQVAKPDSVFEKTYEPHGDVSYVFQVRGEDFRAGGTVSAWRVSLWNGDQLLAEKKSFLW